MLLHAAKAPGTHKKYKTNWTNWSKFCHVYNFDVNNVDNQYLLLNFAAWKFNTTSNKANTIDKEISGIISIYNSQLGVRQVDRTKFSLLRQLINGMKTIPGRESLPTFPICNFELRSMIKQYSLSYLDIMWKTVWTTAKGYAFRCGEYASKTRKINERTLKWSQLEFTWKNNQEHLSITLDVSKTNRTHKTETITKKCICNAKCHDLCYVHWMKLYRKYFIAKWGSTANKPVFLLPNGKLLLQAEVALELKKVLKAIGIKNPVYPYWRPHSLRHGEITDLMDAGIELWLIKKLVRHTPNSKVTFLYTHLSSVRESEKLHEKYDQYLLKSMKDI